MDSRPTVLFIGSGANVRITPAQIPAVARARWLAEVEETLEQATLLLNRLQRHGYRTASLVELAMRIDAAKREVALLRTSRRSHEQTDPKGRKIPLWREGKHSAL